MPCSHDDPQLPNRGHPGLRHKAQASRSAEQVQFSAARLLCRDRKSCEEQPGPLQVRFIRARDVTLRREQRGQLHELLDTRFIIFVVP